MLCGTCEATDREGDRILRQRGLFFGKTFYLLRRTIPQRAIHLTRDGRDRPASNASIDEDRDGSLRRCLIPMNLVLAG